ncbi:DNA replication ATP-dependent helicase/nuclease DNA2-like [Elysia marginata]|uniref:DNA replication ATP-dependent helicase/nuclease n=1 Tax=Elysia marginata TaxID=1093978 RepID=A0AAV4JJJ8_9GAST|nr:DNA replication ATP-dependent helicase/nuclease DNA2-like [Elysia marginata]
MEMDEAGMQTYQLANLPEPINNERACSKCAHLQTCSIYQRSVEKVERSEGHAMSRLVPDALAHLGDVDLTYFLHWLLCLDVEGQESDRKQLQHIWNSSSQQRERDGECLSNLVITGSELGIPESQSFNDGQGCSLIFSRHPDYVGLGLNCVGLTCGDMVVLSSEDGRLIALATGFVRSISSTCVEIVVDRDYLHNTGVYRGIKFRLDRNNSFTTSGYLYANLSKLMNNESQGAWLRDLIIRQRAPEFELKVSKANLYKVKSVFKPLNKPQRTAILKVLMAKDFVLIKGFPGTGKTSTIVALVKILHLLGLSVLLTSYTHSAVDNILLKLKKDEVPFVRLGRQGRIHPSILTHCAEVLTAKPSIDSVQALREFYDSYSVVATSCLGVSNHPVFSQRHFDVCIVDEASQVQPACLAPLFHCRKFVLVGDPKQLPPVVQSKEARKLGMDISLFAQLDNRGATYDLSMQYRMNRVIMDLSNKLVYNGKLQCGDTSVAEQCLHIDPLVLESEPLWIKATLSCQLENSVVFVDTHQISAPELQDGKGLKNNTEACIILSLLQTLIKGQASGRSIGVISPYRSQVRLLQRLVAESRTVAEVEVNTVDQYQGRDKGVIIVSFVRSHTENIGELLKDLRRLNVALTRARYKLILVGNSSALKGRKCCASFRPGSSAARLAPSVVLVSWETCGQTPLGMAVRKPHS